MRGRFQLADAAGSLEPYQQGSLDGLCGLYAIINAVRLLLHHEHSLTKRQAKRMFEAGVRFIAVRDDLSTVLTRGMPPDLWLNLCEHVLGGLADDGVVIVQRQIIPDRDFRNGPRSVRWIKHCVNKGRPALIALWGAYDHYTVVARYSASRLILFDSHGLRWVSSASIGTVDGGVGRHSICGSTTIELMLKR